MWLTIVLWIIKRVYKRKIKLIKRRYNVDENKALAIIAKSEIKRFKRRILIINILLIVVIICIILYIIFIVYSWYYSYINTTASVANNIINMEEDFSVDNEKEDSSYDWDWDLGNEGSLIDSGGLIIKDEKLRLRAELLEILKKSSEDVQKETGIKIEPAWVLGTAARETGNRIFSTLDNNKISSLFKDLVVLNPACGKSNCSYINRGHSHYIGGYVKDGIDYGNPYKQVINTDKSLYDGDHAVGFIQFEIPFYYERLNRIYGNPEKVISSSKNAENEVIWDNELGFIRPNPFYMPDVMYSGVFFLARTPTNSTSSPSRYKDILNSSDFKSLSEYNQNFIRFIYSTAAYVRGHIRASDDSLVLALIELAKDRSIEELDDLILDLEDKYWDNDSMLWRGSKGAFISDIIDRYSLDVPKDNLVWYGLYSGCMGKLAYNKIVEAIENAETIGGVGGSSNGNWVGRPGSGVYGNNGSKYYLDEVGIRWYHQTSRVYNYSSTWGNLKIGGTTYVKTPYYLYTDDSGKRVYHSTMASGGCGIYTIAMIASNLYNKDITPDIALSALDGKYQNSCLLDAGVGYLANKLGLEVKTLNYKKPDIVEKINAELRRGNMILFVSRAYNGEFPWYNGNGHFMALRGITDDGKYLVISSIGNSKLKMSPIEVMNTPLDPEIFLKYLSPNRNYVWVVGLDVK